MPGLRLNYVDAISDIGRNSDKSQLFQLSQDENRDLLTMDPLTAEEIQSHPVGIVVVGTETSSDRPALGYVACKRVINPGLIEGKAATSESAGAYGYIGGLLLDRAIRHHGIAPGLVERVTEETFARLDEVDACIASCNGAGFAVFQQVGYYFMHPDQKVFVPSPGFIPMIVTREQFTGF